MTTIRRTGLSSTICIRAIIVATAALALACGDGKSPDGAPQAQLWVEEPKVSANGLPIRLAGWAFDPDGSAETGISQVEVLDRGCDGELLGHATYGIAREDVAADRGARFLRSGWEYSIEHMPMGERAVFVRATSAGSNAETCSSVQVNVSPRPMVSIEEPGEVTVLLPFAVSGWAMDLAASEGSGVAAIDVLDGGCNGELLGQAGHGLVRDDLRGRFGDQFARSGWRFIIDRMSTGLHTLAVRMTSTNAGASSCETLALAVE